MQACFAFRKPFQPAHYGAARERIAEKIARIHGPEASWGDRMIALFYTVRIFADRDEVDWFVTDQYNGRSTYYAAMQKLAIFDVADELKSKLWRIGFCSWWETYDASDGRVPSWTDAEVPMGIDPRNYPWGLLGICDMEKPEVGKWRKIPG